MTLEEREYIAMLKKKKELLINTINYDQPKPNCKSTMNVVTGSDFSGWAFDQAFERLGIQQR
jgi:hypothetical protein